MTPEIKEFLLREHEALRSELELHLEVVRDLHKWAILASGGIWTWLATRPAEPASSVARMLPAVLSILFAAIAVQKQYTIHLLGSYIGKIESAFDLPAGLGWESNRWRDGRPLFILRNLSLWGVLIAANILLGFFARFTYVPPAGH